MSMFAKETEKRISDFLQACRSQGVKATHQRIEIYREVASSEAHPDVNTIYQQVKKRIPSIALDTVYRNLKFLSDRGLIKVMGLSQERLRFDANLKEHHHFVCTQCGAIHDFASDSLSKLVVPKEARRLGRAISVQVEVKGVCEKCQK